MKTRLNVWTVCVAAILAAAPVWAGPGGRHGHRFADGGMMPMSPQAPLEQPMRTQEFRQDDGLPLPPGRMSPEERRQLRRDIRNAGEGIYRRLPPPPPDAIPPRQ